MVLSIRILLTPWRTAMGHRGRKSRWPIKLVTRRQSANVFLIPLTLSQDPLPATYPSNAVLPSPWLSLRPCLLPFFLFSSSSPSRSSWNWVHYPPTGSTLVYAFKSTVRYLPGTLIRVFVREPLVTVKRRRAPSIPAIRVDDSLHIRWQSQTSEIAFPSTKTSRWEWLTMSFLNKFWKLVRSFKDQNRWFEKDFGQDFQFSFFNVIVKLCEFLWNFFIFISIFAIHN